MTPRENLLRIFRRQPDDLRSRKRRALNETLVFEFDERFANQALSDAELLRDFSFDDLFAGLDRTREDGFFQ